MTITAGKKIEKNMLSIPNPDGDLRLMWDPRVPNEVKAAKAAFDKAIAEGMLAYSVNTEDGSKGEVIRTFDPEAQKVIMTRPLAGG